jgi:replication factor C subunit 3/5
MLSISLCSWYTGVNKKYSDNVSEKTPIPPPDWEALIAQIAEDIITVHTPQRILEVRSKLYDLLSHCIPATIILKTLTFKLVAHPRVDAELKSDVVKWAAFYEHRIRNGSVSPQNCHAKINQLNIVLESHLSLGGVRREIHEDM